MEQNDDIFSLLRGLIPASMVDTQAALDASSSAIYAYRAAVAYRIDYENRLREAFATEELKRVEAIDAWIVLLEKVKEATNAT